MEPRDTFPNRRSVLTATLAGAAFLEPNRKNRRLPLLGDDDVTADRYDIKEFVLARSWRKSTAFASPK